MVLGTICYPPRMAAAQLALVAGPGFVLQRARATPAASPLSPHFHVEYLLCAQLRGHEACAIDGHTHHLQAGDLMLLNPEQVHTGHADAQEPIEYLSLYGERDWVEGLARELGGRRPPSFRRVQVERASGLIGGLQRLWSSYAQEPEGPPEPTAQLAREEAAIDLYCRALGTYADLRDGRARARPRRRLRAVVDYARARRGPIDLDSLAAVAGLSKYHFIRTFAAELGMTPAAYLRNLRIGEAATDLRRGRTVEAAAEHAGFGDLRSFRRAFRGILGTTPRRYARMCGPRHHGARSPQRKR